MDRVPALAGATAAASRDILIVGSPRSGTTWVARALAHCPGVKYVHEPDNDKHTPFSATATRGMGPLPSLGVGERSPGYEMLWDLAFAGGWLAGGAGWTAARVADRVPAALVQRPILGFRRAQRRRRRGARTMVKSVRALLTTEWIADRYQPAVVLVLRHPLNMLPGWLKLGWGSHNLRRVGEAEVRLRAMGVWPPPASGDLEDAMWTLCAYNSLELATAAAHPDWIVVHHEDLCGEPAARFGALAEALGLESDLAVARYLRESDRPGSGWEVLRIAREEIEGWRTRLSPPQQQKAMAVMARFEPCFADLGVRLEPALG